MSNSPEDSDVGFQIAPMVDVVFVLLLFFMASAGSQLIPKEISVNLPSDQSAQASKVPPVVVRIDVHANGLVEVNGKSFDSASSKELPALRGWLKDSIARFGDKDTVVICPEPQTKQGRVIEVLDAASFAGVKKLTFG